MSSQFKAFDLRELELIITDLKAFRDGLREINDNHNDLS